jgi:two-component system CheB/CheR fusion protein
MLAPNNSPGDDMTRQFKQLIGAVHPPAHLDDEMRIDRDGAKVLAEVAHEMRQPLSAALAALHAMRFSRSSAYRRHACVVLDRQFQRLSHLLDDLIEVSRVQLHGKRLHMLRLDLRTVVEEATEAVAPLFEEKQLQVRRDLPSQHVFVEGDWSRLQQVLSNLLHNAVKFTDKGGVVRVRLTRDEREAILTVADNGSGIAPELLDKMFEPFTTGSGGAACGLGIGLAVVRQVVGLHGGTVSAASPGEGGGAEFVIRLPLMHERRRNPTPEATEVDGA